MLLVIIQLGLIGLFLFFSYLLEKKEVYWLISNYNNRSKEEQEELVQNGYPHRVGKLFRYIAFGLLLLLVLIPFKIPFAMEIYFGFMMLSLFGGMVYLSKYEVKGKRKRSYLFTSIIGIVTISFIVIMFWRGYLPHDLIMKQDSFEITNMYGEEWDYNQIQDVSLVQEHPPVEMKMNGFGTSNLAKGVFRVEGLKVGKLYVYKDQNPFIIIQLKDDGFIILNSKDPVQTQKWYRELKDKIK